MLSSLCPVMAANPFVSRFWGLSGIGRPGQQRFALGFHAASWQHRYLDCGTLNSERSLRSRHQCRAVCGQSLGRSRQWQAPAR
jgi:hypothetical protein